MWDVEYTKVFERWWAGLDEDEQESIVAVAGLLEEQGPALGFPYSSKIFGSRHPRMRELRVQHRGNPYRVFYAFDRRRVAVLLTGGRKTGDDRFYGRLVRIADGLYDRHIEEPEPRS